MSSSPFDPKPPLFPWFPPPVTPKPVTQPLASLVYPPLPNPFNIYEVLNELLRQPARPRVFVSYQHSTDQAYYDAFSDAFHDTYELIYDNSLRGRIRSDNPDYVIQRIRDDFITGTSCTIVLVGPTSYQRKYIDWEIKATLDKGHALIGLQLPNVVPNLNGIVLVPLRLNANINSGYALWHGISWQQLIANPTTLNQHIALARARPQDRAVNPRQIKAQNG